MDRDGGFSLLEAMVALALIGMAVLAGAAVLHAQTRAADRLRASHDLLRLAEATVEGVRGDALPLTSGLVPPLVGVESATLQDLVLSVQVTPRTPSGLYELTVVARCRVRGEPLSRALRTQVWRP